MDTFNTIPLEHFCCTIADISGVTPPKQAALTRVDAIKELVEKKTGKPTTDKMLIYNPDAIGQEFYERYREKIFRPLTQSADLIQPFLTANPPKTPVCFATMFSGASPDVHGIHVYEKPVLTVDTLFDAWAREGKKVALISKAQQSIPRIFAGRDIDYYITGGDAESVNKAIELMRDADYDVIEVYNQEYDDMLHVTHPRSFFCRRAARHYVESYMRLLDAVKTYWKDQTVFTCFAPDHGAHRVGKILNGTHGANLPCDRNILHFFSVLGGKHE